MKEIKATLNIRFNSHFQHVRVYILQCKLYLSDVPVKPMHLRWCTKREWASTPFFISGRQRWSSVNGGFISCCSDSSCGTISSSSASSLSFPLLWTSWATPCNSASLRSPFCARCYRNETCDEYVPEWQSIEIGVRSKISRTYLLIMHCWCITIAEHANQQQSFYNIYTDNKPLEY